MDNVIVGHVRYNLSPGLSQFLRREVNKALLRFRKRKKIEKQVTDNISHLCTAFMDPKFTLTIIVERLERQWTCLATHIIM